MSNVNIKRAVENIRANTTVYTPVVEMIVNAIQAIDESGRMDGKVSVRALRNSQAEIYGSLPDVTSFAIQDNGIGFTNEHRDSFDTLYTDRRIAEGGKGFGRFTCLKYFEDLHVKSVYREGSGFSAAVSRWVRIYRPRRDNGERTPGLQHRRQANRPQAGADLRKKLSTVSRNLTI